MLPPNGNARCKELHMVAHDRVPRQEVWRCLGEQGVPEKYVRLVKDTYEDARTQVKTRSPLKWDYTKDPH